jgi:hypothetical protein
VLLAGKLCIHAVIASASDEERLYQGACLDELQLANGCQGWVTDAAYQVKVDLWRDVSHSAAEAWPDGVLSWCCCHRCCCAAAATAAVLLLLLSPCTVRAMAYWLGWSPETFYKFYTAQVLTLMVIRCVTLV